MVVIIPKTNIRSIRINEERLKNVMVKLKTDNASHAVNLALFNISNGMSEKALEKLTELELADRIAAKFAAEVNRLMDEREKPLVDLPRLLKEKLGGNK